MTEPANSRSTYYDPPEELQHMLSDHDNYETPMQISSKATSRSRVIACAVIATIALGHLCCQVGNGTFFQIFRSKVTDDDVTGMDFHDNDEKTVLVNFSDGSPGPSSGEQLQELSDEYLYESKQESFKQVHEPTNGKKPQLVLHIGPLKTATTTIQAALTGLSFRKIMQREGWYYATAGVKMEDGTELPNLGQLSGADDSFLEKLKDTMEPYRSKNVVHAREGWSVDFAKKPELYEQVHELLSGEWDITVVSGYRPYFDWVLSMWSQAMKRNPFVYSNPDDWPWYESNAEPVEIDRLFPDRYEFWISKHEVFTDSIIDGASPYFNVLTYDMNDPRHPSIAFVCDSLPGATESCEYLKAQVEKEGDLHKNKGSLNLIHYDALGLEAAKQGMVDRMSFTRYQIQQKIKKYTETELEQLPTRDWPMNCPDNSTMQELLDKSIRLEQNYMPQLWSSNPDRGNELRSKFHRKVESRAFCHVDLDTMLADPKWQHFFENYS